MPLFNLRGMGSNLMNLGKWGASRVPWGTVGKWGLGAAAGGYGLGVVGNAFRENPTGGFRAGFRGMFGGPMGAVRGGLTGGLVGAVGGGGLGAFGGRGLLAGARRGGIYGAAIGGAFGFLKGSVASNRPVNRIRGLHQ